MHANMYNGRVPSSSGGIEVVFRFGMSCPLPGSEIVAMEIHSSGGEEQIRRLIAGHDLPPFC
jgi:hypothetical protein